MDSLSAKRLIINADDANLTGGVLDAVLKCHARGVVTSTSWMMNVPTEAAQMETVKQQKNLGVGLHLNITYGVPIEIPEAIPTLIGEAGFFKKRPDYEAEKPMAEDVLQEYEAQIRSFVAAFGRLPTHLDTHHHLHDEAFYLEIVAGLARQWNLPLRRSRAMKTGRHAFKTTDYLLEDLEPRQHWTLEGLCRTVKEIPEGTGELMCHPGIYDAALEKSSSFSKERQAEYEALLSQEFQDVLHSENITLLHFGRIGKG